MVLLVRISCSKKSWLYPILVTVDLIDSFKTLHTRVLAQEGQNFGIQYHGLIFAFDTDVYLMPDNKVRVLSTSVTNEENMLYVTVLDFNIDRSIVIQEETEMKQLNINDGYLVPQTLNFK